MVARSGVRTRGARPLTEIWGDGDGCQQARAERIAVIPRAPFRGRSSEDRDLAAAVIVEVFDAPLAGDYPVLKDLDFGFNRHAGARPTPISANNQRAWKIVPLASRIRSQNQSAGSWRGITSAGIRQPQ